MHASVITPGADLQRRNRWIRTANGISFPLEQGNISRSGEMRPPSLDTQSLLFAPGARQSYRASFTRDRIFPYELVDGSKSGDRRSSLNNASACILFLSLKESRDECLHGRGGCLSSRRRGRVSRKSLRTIVTKLKQAGTLVP